MGGGNSKVGDGREAPQDRSRVTAFTEGTSSRYKMTSENSQSDSDDDDRVAGGGEGEGTRNAMGYTDIGSFKRDYSKVPRGARGAEGNGKTDGADEEMDEAEDLLRSYAKNLKQKQKQKPAAKAQGGATGTGGGVKRTIYMQKVEALPGTVFDEDEDSPALRGTGSLRQVGGFRPGVGGVGVDVRTTVTTTTTTRTEMRHTHVPYAGDSPSPEAYPS